MRRGRRTRAGGDDPHELGEAIESSDALRLRLVMWLARSHGTARARPAARGRAPGPEVELPPTERRRRRPRS